MQILVTQMRFWFWSMRWFWNIDNNNTFTLCKVFTHFPVKHKLLMGEKLRTHFRPHNSITWLSFHDKIEGLCFTEKKEMTLWENIDFSLKLAICTCTTHNHCLQILDNCNTQISNINLKQRLCQILGGKQGVLWKMCKWHNINNETAYY